MKFRSNKLSEILKSLSFGPPPNFLCPATTADHYTAGFVLDESVFTLGVKTLAALAADYLAMKK